MFFPAYCRSIVAWWIGVMSTSPFAVLMTSVAFGAAAVGTVSYRMVGRISVGTPYGRLSAPYDRSGRFAPLSLPMSGLGTLLGRE